MEQNAAQYAGPGSKLRDYDDWHLPPLPLLSAFSTCQRGQGNCGVEFGACRVQFHKSDPIVSQVPWGKTNRRRTIVLTPTSLTSSWGMDRACGVMASNFSPKTLESWVPDGRARALSLTYTVLPLGV
jgi:hypothetical protein